VLMMTTLDFGLKNAPYFFRTFTASLLQHITEWLGEDGFSMYYLDDNLLLGWHAPAPDLTRGSRSLRCSAVPLQPQFSPQCGTS
jgi:hypothetical protein